MESPLNQEAIARAIETLNLPLRARSSAWEDPEGRIRLARVAGRLILRLVLVDEPRAELGRQVDRWFDVAFDLAGRLELDIRDPLLDTLLTRYRYEARFQEILDNAHRKSRVSLALGDPSLWRIFATVVSPARFREGDLPAFETDPSRLPPAIWSSAGRKLGVLELTGEQPRAALARVGPERPFFAILPPGTAAGEDAAVVRVLRICHPVSNATLVEAVTEGVCRIETLSRPEGALTVHIDGST